MPNLKSLGEFLEGQHGNSIFSAGIVGSVSIVQIQIDALMKAFGQLEAAPNDEKAQQNFRSALLASQAFSVITDDELKQCEKWLDEE